MITLRVITAPTAEPVSLETAKEYLRVDGTSEDVLIESLIKSARETGEQLSRRAFVTQTLEMVIDEFPRDLSVILLRPPLQSVTSVKYYDTDSIEATWTDYEVDARSEPGKIIFNSMPGVSLLESGGVAVRYVAGYGDAEANVPERIKNAILAAVAYLYENRWSLEIPREIKSAFLGERVVWF